MRGIFGSPQTKGYKPIAVVAPKFRRLRAGVIPRTRFNPEYAIEWPARAESDEKVTSVVKPAPRGTGVGGRMPWRASTDFCTGFTRKLGLAPERAMPNAKWLESAGESRVAQPAARREKLKPVGQWDSHGPASYYQDRQFIAGGLPSTGHFDQICGQISCYRRS